MSGVTYKRNLFGEAGRTDDAKVLKAKQVDYTPIPVVLQLLMAVRAPGADGPALPRQGGRIWRVGPGDAGALP